ncbi:MAG: DUF4139 domain-containing protein [candidate division Zixibacteria bacterium]|nr:DUF4139 domain-containing protein [candidate division Zixibacteria bacterium]
MFRAAISAIALLLLASSATVADEVAVTVYNSNLGVVSETRSLDLEKGNGRLAFRDVPERIDASSVRFEVVDRGRKVAILEQNYVYDLVSPEQLYTKYIDQTIEMIDKEGHLYSGTLLAFSSGAVTLQDTAGKVRIIGLDNITEVDFPLLPEGLITRPTLFWLYASDFSGQADCNVSYQTTGLNWEAEYVGRLDKDDTSLHLSGWASINNTSGKTYKDAKLKLIAGDINRAQRGPAALKGSARTMEMAMAAPDFQEKAFFEYHMYTLPRSATLANKEIKQLSLFEPSTVKVKKVYLYQPDQNPTDVTVKVEFVNSTGDGLGIPLPAGRVRLFKADDDGAMILLGEDRVDHTPKDEEVSLTVGTAFDIVAEEKILDHSRISAKVEERTYQIELRNRKDTDITVKVAKNFWGFWEIVSANYEYEKKESNVVHFSVPVKANSTARLDLRVRFTSR